MTEYTCERCGKIFDHRGKFNRHINRKYKCKKKTYNSKTNKTIYHKCLHCKKNYSRKDSLKRHLATCKEKITKISNSTIKKSNNGVKNKGNENKIINNSNNKKTVNTYNINNPIILVAFCKDGFKCIDPDTFNKLMKSKKNMIETLIKDINLNPKKPQHHNVYYGDLKSSYGEIYENKKWVKMKINEILDTLIETKVSNLNDYLNKMRNYLNEETRNKIKETIESMDYTKPDAIKKLRTYLKPLLYNSKDMIMDTRKTIKDDDEIQEDQVHKKNKSK